MSIFYTFIFLACCGILYLSGEWIVAGLMRIARYFGWREFVVAFIVMAFAASLPNLFVGITSALHKVPQLSFGDVAGNNLVALTIGVGLAILFTKGGIPVESRTVQTTATFVIFSAILPLLLILDGKLSRVDGVLLIGFFIFYLCWLFSKKERFTRIYDEHKTERIGVSVREFKIFLKDIGKVIAGLVLLIFAAQGIVISAQFFAQILNISIILVGLLITGVGNALPEVYFAVASAKKEQTWMILGNLMGAVIVPATLVLGIVALIYPIEVQDFSPFAIARVFLIFSALFFFFSARTGRKITKKEAIFLIAIYFLFVICQLLIK